MRTVEKKLDLCMQHWNQSCWHNNCLFNYFICSVQSNRYFLSLSFVVFLGTSPLLLSFSSTTRQWKKLYFYSFRATHWITIAAGKRQLPHTLIIKRSKAHTQYRICTIIMWCESNRRQKYMVENFDGNVFIFCIFWLLFPWCWVEVKMLVRNNAGICGGKTMPILMLAHLLTKPQALFTACEFHILTIHVCFMWMAF